MVYATLEDYTTWLKGRTATIPLTEFDHWADQASRYLDSQTWRKIPKLLAEDPSITVIGIDDLAMAACECTCALAESMFAYNEVESENRGISSVTVTKHTLVFDTKAISKVQAYRNIIWQYFGYTELTFRGVDSVS